MSAVPSGARAETKLMQREAVAALAGAHALASPPWPPWPVRTRTRLAPFAPRGTRASAPSAAQGRPVLSAPPSPVPPMPLIFGVVGRFSVPVPVPVKDGAHGEPCVPSRGYLVLLRIAENTMWWHPPVRGGTGPASVERFWGTVSGEDFQKFGAPPAPPRPAPRMAPSTAWMPRPGTPEAHLWGGKPSSVGGSRPPEPSSAGGSRPPAALVDRTLLPC